MCFRSGMLDQSLFSAHAQWFAGIFNCRKVIAHKSIMASHSFGQTIGQCSAGYIPPPCLHREYPSLICEEMFRGVQERTSDSGWLAGFVHVVKHAPHAQCS
jgi:hypothetical protein